MKEGGELSMCQIKAIELENFQSISKRTRIELKPITLMFGPNSAGKSAVFDAIELMSLMLDPVNFDEKNITDLVDRWARKSGNGTDEERYTTVAIEFELDLSIEPTEVLEKEEFGRYATKEKYPLIDWSWRLDERDLLGPEGESTAKVEFNLKIENYDGKKRCEINEFRCFFNDDLILVMCNETANYSPPGEENECGWYSCYKWLVIPDRESVFYPPFIEDDVKNIDFLKVIDPSKSAPLGSSPIYVLIEPKLCPFNLRPTLGDNVDDGNGQQYFCQVSADIFFYLGKSLGNIINKSPTLVISDRRSPRKKETAYMVYPSLSGWWPEDSKVGFDLIKSRIGAADETIAHFDRLAELSHAETILRAAESESWADDSDKKYLEPLAKGCNQLNRINSHLERNLYKEKLYRLCATSSVVVPVDTSNTPYGFYSLGQPAIVHLFLKDGHGNRIELYDVGSGIPYVLPVLYVATSQAFARIQQPELHLHPALQTSLADTFIEETNLSRNSQFLIETHSEHLLLRLLRRVRDTENDKTIDDLLKLTNSSLSIYYFDPKIDGETVVVPLPVTPLGDFYTDWPRGFFEERNDDLFSE